MLVNIFIYELFRHLQSKRYQEQLLHLKIRELNQEMATINRQVQRQSKDRPINMHPDQRMKEITAELMNLQNQIADYNNALDKIVSGSNKEEILREVRKLKELNDQNIEEMEHLFMRRQMAEKRLHELNKDIESKRKIAEKFADPQIRGKYEEAFKEKIELQREIDMLQGEFDQFVVVYQKYRPSVFLVCRFQRVFQQQFVLAHKLECQ